MSEAETEAAIVAAGKTAPRLTPAHIDSTILAEQYLQPVGTSMTICVLTLKNGFLVTGESAAASPENFDEAIGRKISRENARNKIWPLEGYLLREHLYRGTVPHLADYAELHGDLPAAQIDRLANWIMANAPNAIQGEGAVDTAIAIMAKALTV